MTEIETPSKDIPTAIATLLTTCFSCYEDKAIKKIDYMMKTLSDNLIIHEYDIRKQKQRPIDEWEIKVIFKASFHWEYHIVTMKIKKVELGYQTFMNIESTNIMQ